MDKMPRSDKIVSAMCGDNRPVLKTDVSFFTSFTCKAFKNDFYFLAEKLWLRRSHPGLIAQLVDAQNDLKAGLHALQKETLMKDYPVWLLMGNTLQETKLSVDHLNREFLKLSETFAAVDVFLIPPYVARTANVISATELKAITGKVKVLSDAMVRRFSEQVGDFATR